MHHRKQHPKGESDIPLSLHWSELPEDEQIRFWQEVDAGTREDFLLAPTRKQTRRTRGDHSTKAKCEFPVWYRPAHYKKLSGQMGRAYNRLVMFDKVTGLPRLRIHISRHPLFVTGRRKAGRKYGFRPERQRLNDALWPLLVSFCDGGKHTVGMCISRLAKELSPKDENGNVIPETEVTVSRLSRLIDELVRFGVLGLAEERTWDRDSRSWLPVYVYITPAGFQMLGVDMEKLQKEQEKKLRLSAERERLIREGAMNEHDEIPPHKARQCWSGQKRRDALTYRRKKGAERKRASNLIKLPADERLRVMETWVYKTLPHDEAYWCTPERLTQLAVQHLYQLDLALSPPD
ncbi:plasmid replication initiator RepA [Enterobacter kobei]|uniref:plasmid replication initiator RepA n=1 Tax=Enterobacter kobei TaxID=208224 RepID=UPI003BDA3EFA